MTDYRHINTRSDTPDTNLGTQPLSDSNAPSPSSYSEREAPLREAEVAAYLNKHPDFLSRHRKLLTDMLIPHECGSATSLLERQIYLLRNERTRLQKELTQLIQNARANDKQYHGLRRLVLSLIEAQDLGDLLDALHGHLTEDFGVEYLKILFFMPDVSKKSAADYHLASVAEVISIEGAQAALPQWMSLEKPFSGRLSFSDKKVLFGEEIAPIIDSAAVCPLAFGNPVGLLAMGSQDAARYGAKTDTLFLSYLGEVLNRLLPQILPDDLLPKSEDSDYSSLRPKR